MINLYIMPIGGDGTKQAPFGPKYRQVISPAPWTMYDYGGNPHCLVAVLDITESAHQQLVEANDCICAPTNLDTPVGMDDIGRLQLDLEDHLFPAHWITPETTWRDVILHVGAACQYAQRYQGMTQGKKLFDNNVTLDSPMTDLHPDTDQTLAATSHSFKLSHSRPSAIRHLITDAAVQYVGQGQPLLMAGVSIYNV